MSIQITDPRLVRRIQYLARREQREPQEIIADAVAFYEARPGPKSFLLAIADLGASNQGDIAERDEEILAAEVQPLSGWGPDSDAGSA
ncbi:MAG TPA: hypothetical protein PKL16_05825 [Anaerolineae bacterium]|nr:MAG: hypothetical protein BWY25_01724 [Chloroflexi bacterium ADurb.Bin222]HOC20998.1 hypothetical protein [Anaerolineae bacterium]HQM13918.1 hypothetical protein [Anaerolineae bacterium]